MGFTQLEEVLPPTILSNKINNKREPCFEDLFFFCTCNHLDTGHINAIGKCDYLDCICQKFVEANLVIRVKIAMMDLFLMENPETIFDDSPQFWYSFKIWSEQYAEHFPDRS